LSKTTWLALRTLYCSDRVGRDKVPSDHRRHHVAPVTNCHLLRRNRVACLVGHVAAHRVEVDQSCDQPGLHKPCHEKGSCEDEAPRQGQVSQIDKEGDVLREHCRGDVGEVLDTGGMLAS